MGYLTQHECQTVLTKEQMDSLESIAKYPSDMLTDGSQCESIKWYDFEKDVKEFSENYPDQLFEWWGEGEEQGDLWRAYVKNGKYKLIKAKIIYDDFTEDMLK